MKLVGSVIVRNELDRYLEPCVASLLEFCDEVRILDDGSTDGWQEACRGVWGDDGRRVLAVSQTPAGRNSEPAFYGHAAARNRLLEFTLAGWPTHVLAIDADEFVSDGAAVRQACEGRSDVWSLTIEEIWEACDDRLCVREDGGWRSHEIGVLWRADAFRRQGLMIPDHGHATGRVPSVVGGGRTVPTGVQLLHFGWANLAERDERYARYAIGDGGRFHAKAHIESIMWPPARIECRARTWPAGLESRRDMILARARGERSAAA